VPRCPTHSTKSPPCQTARAWDDWRAAPGPFLDGSNELLADQSAAARHDCQGGLFTLKADLSPGSAVPAARQPDRHTKFSVIAMSSAR
jgi:hypothetical protein